MIGHKGDKTFRRQKCITIQNYSRYQEYWLILCTVDPIVRLIPFFKRDNFPTINNFDEQLGLQNLKNTDVALV